VTRTPLSGSKGQGHQAALLTAVLRRQAAAAVSVGTYCYVAVGSAARGASAPTEGGEGHIMSPRAQLVLYCVVLVQINKL